MPKECSGFPSSEIWTFQVCPIDKSPTILGFKSRNKSKSFSESSESLSSQKLSAVSRLYSFERSHLGDGGHRNQLGWMKPSVIRGNNEESFDAAKSALRDIL